MTQATPEPEPSTPDGRGADDIVVRDGAGEATAFREGMGLDELWALYKSDGSADARDRLILHFAPLVKFVAGRIGSGLPASVEQGDLVSYGILGLIDAIEKFEPDRGIKFETYAMPRIRGSIMDELRALDWVPRSVRTKARDVEVAIARLEGKLKRAPTDEELAEEMGIEVRQLQSRLGEISQLSVVMLEDMLSAGSDRSERLSVLDTIEDLGTPRPGASIEMEETRQELRHALDNLGEREKLVITLYYFERLTLSQIGDILGVTESRVSQIHTKAVLGLRATLAGTGA